MLSWSSIINLPFGARSYVQYTLLGIGRGPFGNGHQNHRPSSPARDGVINERTMSVSNNRPRPMVLPACPIELKSLATMDIMVNAKTSPAEVTTPPVPPWNG